MLFVTGTIGDALLGLHVAQGTLAHDAELLQRYHLPQPRVVFAAAIRDYATAALDVSDGLLQDARHLATQSGVALAIALDALPLSDAAHGHASDAESLLRLATGGDDYELLFTAPLPIPRPCTAPRNPQAFASLPSANAKTGKVLTPAMPKTR